MPYAARPPSQSLGDRPALDGIRALAVLAVLGFHTGVPLLSGGGLGVTGFFVLSGFLITTLLLEEHSSQGSLDLPRFLGRRVLRLLPALLLFSIGVILLHPLGVGARTDALGLGSALTWTSNWVRALSAHPLGAVAHTWSLAVEAQFYLVWPPLLLLAHRARGIAGVRGLAVALALLSLLLRVLLWDGPASTERLRNGTDTAADQLLWGCALATFAPHQRTPPAWLGRVGPTIPVLVVLGWVGVNLLSSHALSTVGYSLASVLSGALVAAAVVELRGMRWLGRGAVRWVGRLSYGVYLWHFPLILCLQSWFHTEDHPWLQFALCTALSVCIAWASFTLLETPIRRRLRPLVEVPRSAAAPADCAGLRAPR